VGGIVGDEDGIPVSLLLGFDDGAIIGDKDCCEEGRCV